jgi:glycerate 2-kinase
LPHGGGALSRLHSIDCTRQDPRLTSVEVIVACDVTNPLTGRHGAARVYGPQKGATPAMVRELDAGLAQFAKVISRDLGKDVLHTPGSGAAGGLGAGLIAFLNARLERGVELVMETVELEKHLADCHLVITGEGRMDGQTAFGKTAAGVARAAKQRGIPVIAICGSLGKNVRSVLDIGIDAYFSALQEPLEESQLRGRGKSMLEDCAEQVGRLLTLARGRAATI